MPSLGHGLGLGLRSGGVDPDAAAFFSRAGITDPAQKVAVNRLVGDLKSAGLWTKMAAIYPMVGGTALAHSKNLKANIYNITWVNGPTHNASGVTGNGTTQYGDTGLAMTNLDPVDVHASCYLSGAGAIGDAFGAWDGGQRIFGFEATFGGAPAASTMDINHLVDGRMTSSAIDGFNLTVMTRRSLSDAEGYSRGVSVATKVTSIGSILPAANNLFIMCRDDAGAPNWFIPSTFKFVSFGLSLTTPNVTSLQTIVQRYQTALGRQIA